MKFADLHLHTFFSDGTFSPEELAGVSCPSGLCADRRLRPAQHGSILILASSVDKN